MRPINAPMTVKQVNSITKQGMTCVGGAQGLYLYIRGSSRSWVYRYTSPETHKKTMTSIGSCSAVSLQAARKIAQDLCRQVDSGVDPIREKRRGAAAAIKAEEAKRKSLVTFEVAANEWLQSRLESGYYSDPETSVYRVRLLLNKIIFPAIGDKPMAELGAEDIFNVMKPYWVEHVGTRKKLQAVFNGVCRWAMAKGYCKQVVSDARGPLGVLYESLGRAHSGRNHGALNYVEVPKFYSELARKGTVAAKQFQLALLTASRSKPVRMLTWSQIDFDKKQWVCPEESMKVKGRGDFVVYLSNEAIALLKSLPRHAGTDLVFPTPTNRPYSDVAMRAMILRLHAEAVSRGEKGLIDEEQSKRLGKPVLITQHGTCRACFKTWSKSDGNAKRFNAEAVELCLAHQIDYRFGGAYDRASLEAERREVMAAWGKFCTSKM